MKTIIKRDIFGKTTLALLGFTVIGTGFLIWQDYQINKENREIISQTEQLDQEIKQLSSIKDLEKTKDALVTYRKALDYRIPWSSVVGEIFRQETARTKFSSFSSGREKKINITGKTTSWEEVAVLLERLKANPRIEEPFIASVSEKREKNNTLVYHFTLTFNFVSS